MRSSMLAARLSWKLDEQSSMAIGSNTPYFALVDCVRFPGSSNVQAESAVRHD